MTYATSILIWFFITLAVWIIFVEVILRILRHYVDFPIPAFIGRFIDNPIRRRIQSPSKVVNWINIESSMKVLEVGPGPGTFTVEAAKRTSVEGYVIAVDIQPPMILKLRGRLEDEDITNVEPMIGSALNLPLRKRTFDRVFMVAVFGELPNKEKALKEIGEVLRDDGLLAIGEFLPDPDCPRKRTIIGWCERAGFKLTSKHGGLLHYLLIFKKERG